MMKADESIPPFDLIVSLDRSDKTLAVAVLDVAGDAFLSECDVSTAPEGLKLSRDGQRMKYVVEKQDASATNGGRGRR